MGESLVSCFLAHAVEVGVHGKPVGECLRPDTEERSHVRTHANTDGRITRKHNVLGAICRMDGGIKMPVGLH